MKEILIILDGLMEEALEGENIKNLILGKLNLPYKLHMVDFSVQGKDIDSLNCIMNILGYSSNSYNIGDRAYYEGLANNINIGDDEVILRCNTVKVENEILTDFTGGNIDNNISDVIKKIKIPNAKLYHLDKYKNLLVMKKEIFKDANFYPPHFNMGKNINELIRNNKAINEIITISKDVFSKENMKGNMLWPWGISEKINLPSYKEKNKKKGCIISGIDLLFGIAKAIDMDYVKCEGATGYEDTNLKSKLEATINAFNKFDLVVVHINGLDELAHKKKFNEKLEFLKKIKNEFIKPLLQTVNECKLTITCDHMTDSFTGCHEDGSVFLIEIYMK